MKDCFRKNIQNGNEARRVRFKNLKKITGKW